MKLEIFKVGKHTSSNGVEKDYSLSDLEQIVKNHSEQIPIVVGHPKTNSPAFGWIKKLFVQDNSLFAEALDIVPEFLELVKQKIYPNRSASFSTNEDGSLQLKHVGFLGGTLPAVKGLKEIEFSDDTESYEFDFSEIDFNYDELKVAPKPKEKKKVEKKSKPNDLDFTIQLDELKSIVTDLTLKYNEVLKSPMDTSAINTKIDDLNLKLDAAYFQRNVQDKLNYSSLTPALQTKVVDLLNYFESLDFSEEQSSKLVSDFQELVDLITPFQTDEILKKVEISKTVVTNEFKEMNVDKDSLKLFNEATQYAKENEISFADAVNVLTNNVSEA
jgi:hypothetical protein